MNTSQSTLAIIVFVLGSLLQGSAWADFKSTPEEQQMCAATIYNRAVPGNPNWAHMHHFCDCVRFTNRAYAVMRKDKQGFSHNLNEAISGCDYVISHATPDFDFLPEIYLQKGIIFSLREKPVLAAAEYTKALNGNPKLARAYVGMAEFFIKSNNKKKALETIITGLQNNPENKALKRMYKKLGGTMPYPTHAQTAPVESLNKKPDASLTTTPVTPVEQAVAGAIGKTPENSTPALTPGKPEKQEIKPTTASDLVKNPHEIGSSSNPWCRFCPNTPTAPPTHSPSTPGATPKAEQ